MGFRAVALLAVHNERRFIRACLEHLIGQGLEVYLLDNESTDSTVDLARDYLGRGLIEVERFPRPSGAYHWGSILKRKEELAESLDADWFMHVDADEIRLPPAGVPRLIDAFRQADAAGYNAVNFIEFSFVPTCEAPDHDHPDFQRTMRSYYCFLPSFPHRLNAWKKQPARVDLAGLAGHQVAFEGLRMYPQSFPMRHYLFLSVPHVIEKYIRRRYHPDEVRKGWHKSRMALSEADVRLLSASECRTYVGDDQLDDSAPRRRHPLFTQSA
ncbi:MAG: glycosyltransferase [Pseudomonadota bacterium]|nr:MAG: glycosyltransferase [Pseudomonadota bacterium]